MGPVTFSMDQYNAPIYHATDERYELLGQWAMMDISRYFLACLDALAMIDDVTHGRAPFEEWSSDNYEVTFTSSTFAVSNNWIPGRSQSYPIDVVRSVVEDYWRFLVEQPERNVTRQYRPDLPEWQAGLVRWEEKWGRPHPYRGRFF
ncbi:hypothetical protein [Catenuloplanes atrovinosus]|uniref:Uncharacterized protein n=1 Tax=Catenuloplanes atrovinosus TaxID=137266 RepID=A0AAE3YTJ9_9ACTN|nr:hypothetical protein [Catenuloplanes atrovinosus]MDR7278977.1 hypothetical protein [Catenuloplanes atrovinosus]